MRAPVSPTLFDQFARGWRGYALVALVALLSCAFGLNRLPVFDSSEAQFALASRDLAAGANLPGLGAHWAQSVSAHLVAADTTSAIWPYRLPSLLGVVLAALAAFWGGAALIGRRAALLGAALFAAGVLAGFMGMLATADALGLGFFTVAMAALARVRGGAGWATAALFWNALAVAIAVQGFGPALLSALTLGLIAVWERRAAWMRPLAAWPSLALGLPMFVLALWGLGGAGADAMFGAFAGRYSTGDHPLAPPGYHLFLLPFLIFPATYALPAAARLAWEAFRAAPGDDAHAATRFLIAWALPAFLVFEPALVKAPNDALPAYPAIALLCGAGLMAMRRRRWRTAPPAGLVMFAVCGVVLVALMAVGATFIPGDLSASLRRAIATALVGALTVGFAVAALVAVRHPAARAAALIACALALSFSAREQLLPQARTLFVTNEASAALTRARLFPPEGRPIWAVDYDEPSLQFLHRGARPASAEEAATNVKPGDVVILEGRAQARLDAGLAQRALQFTPAEPPARGFALGRGERVSLFVGVVDPIAAAADGRPQNP